MERVLQKGVKGQRNGHELSSVTDETRKGSQRLRKGT